MLVELDMEEGLTEEIKVIWEGGSFTHCFWVYVIFFACASGGEVCMSVLHLTIPIDTFFWIFLAILKNF